MDSTSQTFHFKIDCENAVRSVVQAIAFVKGRDPMDLEPLGKVVDPDSLDELITEWSGTAVSFEIEDLDVEITSAGDIYIVDPTPESFIHESIDDASNVLLQTDSHDDECCVDLLSLEPYDEECLLGISYAGSVETRVSAWNRYMDQPPTDATVVNVGDFPRSATQADGDSVKPSSGDPVTYVPDPHDVSKLEATITAELSTFEGSEKQLVVCFDSVTRLLQNGTRERAVRYLRTLTKQVAAADGIAHYHFDPEPFDEETVARITTLFDAHVEVATDGTWTVESA